KGVQRPRAAKRPAKSGPLAPNFRDRKTVRGSPASRRSPLAKRNHQPWKLRNTRGRRSVRRLLPCRSRGRDNVPADLDITAAIRARAAAADAGDKAVEVKVIV